MCFYISDVGLCFIVFILFVFIQIFVLHVKIISSTSIFYLISTMRHLYNIPHSEI